MEAPVVDLVTLEMYISQILEKHTKRQIAGILSDIEAFTGEKDKRRSAVVKDIANMSKRVMFTKLTGLEVEPIHAGPSQRSTIEEPTTADNGSD